VWLLALVLAPCVAALEYTTQALEIDSFVQRIMRPLLEQNYQRNTHMKRAAAVAAAAAGGAAAAGSGRGGKAAGGKQERQQPAEAPAPAAPSKPPAAPAAVGEPAAGNSTLPVGSDQFAQNAEVLITGGGSPGGLAPATPAGSGGAAPAAPAAPAAALAPAAAADRALLPRTNSGSSATNTQRTKAGRASKSVSSKVGVWAGEWVGALAGELPAH
jgi:hypothetical protein